MFNGTQGLGVQTFTFGPFPSTDFPFLRFSNGILVENRQPIVMWGINPSNLYRTKITVNVLTLIMNGMFHWFPSGTYH